jgi:hypothetical protein
MRTHPLYTSDAAIEAIGTGLLNRTLPKPEWNHAAHFAAAIWLLALPDIDAVAAMPGIIRAYNEATGVANTDTGGYHETITQASLRAAAHALAWPLHDACNTLLASPCGDPDWLQRYWSRERLFSAFARSNWAEPDVTPFPFAVIAPNR